MTHQPLWLSLCHLPGIGRKETEEQEEEGWERKKKRGKVNDSAQRNMKLCPLPPSIASP